MLLIELVPGRGLKTDQLRSETDRHRDPHPATEDPTLHLLIEGTEKPQTEREDLALGRDPDIRQTEDPGKTGPCPEFYGLNQETKCPQPSVTDPTQEIIQNQNMNIWKC